jgi:DamX protein
MSNNFHGGHWGQCLELLSHLCQYGNDILLVSGPPGIGKTTMKDALIRQNTETFMICEVWATPLLTTESLAERIELEFDNTGNKELLLLIDDAQNLSLDIVTLLLQLRQKFAATGILHIVLFATTELEQKISRSVIKDEFFEQTHTIEIEPLTLSEVQAFLTHEWREVHNAELLLSKSKFKKIYTLSGGIPGKAKNIAKEVLAGKDGSHLSEDKSKLSPFAVGVTVSFGVLFCILAIVWPSADETALIKQSKTLQIASSEPVIEAAAVIDSESELDPLANAVLSNADLANNEPIDPAILSSAVTADEKMARLERKLEALQLQLSGEREARRAAEAKFNHTQLSQKPTNVTDKVIAKVSPNVTPKVVRNSTHESHLLAMPGQNYAIQLLGTNDEKKAQAFIVNNKLTNKAYYYKGIHKGKPWFIVISGNYSSKLEAQKALSKLPLSLRKQRPWPRQYSMIQKSINKHNKND